MIYNDMLIIKWLDSYIQMISDIVHTAYLSQADKSSGETLHMTDCHVVKISKWQIVTWKSISTR